MVAPRSGEPHLPLFGSLCGPSFALSLGWPFGNNKTWQSFLSVTLAASASVLRSTHTGESQLPGSKSHQGAQGRHAVRKPKLAPWREGENGASVAPRNFSHSNFGFECVIKEAILDIQPSPAFGPLSFQLRPAGHPSEACPAGLTGLRERRDRCLTPLCFGGSRLHSHQ